MGSGHASCEKKTYVRWTKMPLENYYEKKYDCHTIITCGFRKLDEVTTTWRIMAF